MAGLLRKFIAGAAGTAQNVYLDKIKEDMLAKRDERLRAFQQGQQKENQAFRQGQQKENQAFQQGMQEDRQVHEKELLEIRGQKGLDTPAGRREYEAYIADVSTATDENGNLIKDQKDMTVKEKAAAIKLRMIPGAQGSAELTAAQDPELRKLIAQYIAEKEFGKQSGKSGALSFFDRREEAIKAARSVATVTKAREILDSDKIITGFGANFKLGAGKALKALGVDLATDDIANTEAYYAMMAKETGRIITLFGAGTGLSDADREYAAKASAGDVSMTKESLKKILRINEEAVRKVVENFNRDAKNIPEGYSPFPLTIDLDSYISDSNSDQPQDGSPPAIEMTSPPPVQQSSPPPTQQTPSQNVGAADLPPPPPNVLAEARAALNPPDGKQGADRQQVIQRLRELGYSAEGL